MRAKFGADSLGPYAGSLSKYGERVVLRILDKDNAFISLDLLGMSDNARAVIRLEELSPTYGAERRRLLVFADNRQDAAFFAPFFERTARDQGQRGSCRHSMAASSRRRRSPSVR